MEKKPIAADKASGGINKPVIRRAAGMLPTGTVTFLFTDIQGSTPLWERQPELMSQALEVHNTALRQAIEANGGVVFKIVGDAFQAAFPTAPQALKAAIEGQRALQIAPWNELGPLKVRMGLHTGEAELDAHGDEYAVSHAKNRVARIMSAGYGGQILLSREAADLCETHLQPGVSLKDLGEHALKGLCAASAYFRLWRQVWQKFFHLWRKFQSPSTTCRASSRPLSGVKKRLNKFSISWMDIPWSPSPVLAGWERRV
jgi:class 3 adenylate cyclase